MEVRVGGYRRFDEYREGQFKSCVRSKIKSIGGEDEERRKYGRAEVEWL